MLQTKYAKLKGRVGAIGEQLQQVEARRKLLEEERLQVLAKTEIVAELLEEAGVLHDAG